MKGGTDTNWSRCRCPRFPQYYIFWMCTEQSIALFVSIAHNGPSSVHHTGEKMEKGDAKEDTDGVPAFKDTNARVRVDFSGVTADDRTPTFRQGCQSRPQPLIQQPPRTGHYTARGV